MFVFHYVSNVLIFFSSLFFYYCFTGRATGKVLCRACFHLLYNKLTPPVEQWDCPTGRLLSNHRTALLHLRTIPIYTKGTIEILCGCRQSTPPPRGTVSNWLNNKQQNGQMHGYGHGSRPLQPYQQPQQPHGQQMVAPPVPSPGRGMPLMPPGHMRSPSPRHMAPHGQPVVTTMQNFPRNADRNGDSGNSRLPHPQQVGAQAQLPSPMQPPPHPSEQPLMPSQQSANRNRLPPTPLQDRTASGDYQGTMSPNTPPARTMDHANSPAPVTCAGVSTPAGNRLTSQSSTDSPLCTPTSGIPKGAEGATPPLSSTPLRPLTRAPALKEQHPGVTPIAAPKPNLLRDLTKGKHPLTPITPAQVSRGKLSYCFKNI